MAWVVSVSRSLVVSRGCAQVCVGLYLWLPLREEKSPRYVSSPSMGLAPWSHLQHLLFGNLNAETAIASGEAAL